MYERVTRLSLAGALALCAAAATAGNDAGKFVWTTKSEEAKVLLKDVQWRVESFQFGAETVELARKVVKADPDFALGQYYVSVFEPDPKAAREAGEKAAELAKQASEGERRFIEAMAIANANGGANFRDGIPHLEKIAADYPDERLVQVILGQLYQADNQWEKARAAFKRTEELKPGSPRVKAFLATDLVLKGRYTEAREAYAAVTKALPEGAAPGAIRYGAAFTYLYEGDPDAAIKSLEAFLAEYRQSGAAQGFPEVFIWNSIARINLESGRPEAAMAAYEKGYGSVPGSGLPDDQKQVWLGRLRHGKARALAKLGKTDEAWAEAEAIRKMIEVGGDAGKQYWPAYHYLAGYLKLEAGDAKAAVEHLKQADPKDPFHRLLLARAYERLGEKESARGAYQEVLASTTNSIERALAYPEARKKLGS
ncbi:MAG TPA: tetratricopeptide repeat protein [Vicinamibacteria bacterium]|nr:tetratricopeptide repeat protein [Vicinamibacteria bacterium]